MTTEVYLRPIEDRDVGERYLSWFRSAGVTQFLVARDLARDEVHQYVEEGRATGRWYMYAICDAENDLHIGNLKVGDIDLTHGVSDLVTVIGDESYWGRGIATQVIRMGTQLAFDTHRLRKVSGSIAETNIGSLRAYTRAGWVEEGRLRGAFLFDGVVQDKVLVSCFNPAYFDEDRQPLMPDLEPWADPR